MKFILALFTLCAVTGSGFCDQPKIKPPQGYTKLIWHDEFDGDKLDTEKWSRIPPGKGQMPDWIRYTSLRPDLVKVKNGLLILIGVKNKELHKDPRPCLQGQVWSKGKFSFSLGKVEIRAKFENRRGAWPAFWMLPDKGKWPDGGEIDIMEHLNSDPFIYQTCHSRWTQIMKQKKNPPFGTKTPIQKNQFNLYSLEWTQNLLIWSVNGRETFRYPRNGHPDQWPFERSPFFLLLDMQLGGWAGPIDFRQLPVHVYIDYVRVWQK